MSTAKHTHACKHKCTYAHIHKHTHTYSQLLQGPIGPMQAASQALAHVQALLGNNHPNHPLPNGNRNTAGPGKGPGGGGLGGGPNGVGGPLGGIGSGGGHTHANNVREGVDLRSEGQEDLEEAPPLPPGPQSVAATVSRARGLAQLTIEVSGGRCGCLYVGVGVGGICWV